MLLWDSSRLSPITERSSAARSRAGSHLQRIRTRRTRHPAPPSFSRGARRQGQPGTDDRAAWSGESRSFRSGEPGSYGPAFNAPAGAKIWNPVKLKLQQGGKVTGGTLFSATDPATYCAMANAGYDFIWTEMQHDQRDWQAASRMWRTCPQREGGSRRPRRLHGRARDPARARRGCVGDRRSHRGHGRRSDRGAELDVLPPLGRRSNGGGQALRSEHVGRRAGRLPQHDQRQHRV